MSFRRKLLLVFGLTVVLCVGAVTWIVSALTRRAFERANEDQTTALVAQFRREFNRRGDEVAHQVETVAASEAATRMALAVSRGSADYSGFVNQAKALADNQQLDFLEFADSGGTILSSAQWPAKFGYKDNSLPLESPPQDAFLRQEDLPDGVALSLSAIRPVQVGDKPIYVIGGRRLDKDFISSLGLPSGMRAILYRNLAKGFSPDLLIAASGSVAQPQLLAPLIERVQQQPQETTALIHWSDDAADDESVHAIPLSGRDHQLLGILLVGNTRRPYVELRNRIRSAALLAGAAGIILAILFSGWASSRVTRPVEQLAEAAREVAAGNWNTRVPVDSSDELGALAESFNRMTSELLEQRERLVQAERVAAWRELARRLAHELKNPLFPLQLTVENLVRARQQSPEQFDEVFRESSSTLLAEIANLKTIISRFSEFSRMPQPQFQRVQINEIVQKVARLLQGATAVAGASRDRMPAGIGGGASTHCGGSRTASSGVFQSGAERHGCHAAGRDPHLAYAPAWRPGGGGNCRYRRRPDRGRMRTAVHALLHQQGPRYRTRTRHRAVDHQRPWRQDQRAQPAGTGHNVYDRTAGEFRQTARGGPGIAIRVRY